MYAWNVPQESFGIKGSPQWQSCDLHIEFKVHELLKFLLCFWMKEGGAEETDEVWAHNRIHCKEEHVTEKDKVK